MTGIGVAGIARAEGIVAGTGGYTRFKELQAWAMVRRGPGD